VFPPLYTLSATENLDDLTATERAARTHPDAPPHLPPLPFADHAEEMAGILYAPELVAPPPIIWLPNDSAGVARSEALDLQKYHNLQVTLDVRSKDDVPRRSSDSRRRSSDTVIIKFLSFLAPVAVLDPSIIYNALHLFSPQFFC
jgi:hypothetical protein